MAKAMSVASKQPDNGDIVFLDELKEGFTGSISVMVCRKWDVNSPSGAFISTDYIMSDKKGNIIHCIARNKIALRFCDRLNEGIVYMLRGFVVEPNREQYRVLKDNPYMLALKVDTMVKKSSEDVSGFVRHPFVLVPFEQLKPTDTKYFVDVVGYVMSVGSPSKKSNGSYTVDFNLTNERGKQVRVTLWGVLGDIMAQKKSDHPGAYAVILTSMTVKFYNFQLCLSSSSSTLIFDEASIPALKSFKDALSGVQVSDSGEMITQQLTYVDTLSELLSWARAGHEESVVFKGDAEIMGLRTKNSWFTFSCNTGKCRKGVTKKSEKFWCEGCETSVSYPRIRFRVEMNINDGTMGICVVLFDEAVQNLVNRTAKSLWDDGNKDDHGDCYAIPAVLDNLVGKTYNFEVKSQTYYHYEDYESFSCSQVLTSTALLPTANVASASTAYCSPVTSVVNVLELATPSKTSETLKRKIHVENSETEVDEYASKTSETLKRKIHVENSETEVNEHAETRLNMKTGKVTRRLRYVEDSDTENEPAHTVLPYDKNQQEDKQPE